MGIRNFDAEVEKAVKRIQELAEDGKPPTVRIFDANRGDCLGSDVFKRRGLAWLKLVEMAGFPVPRIQFGTPEEEIEKAIKRIQELAVNGIAPTRDEYNKVRGSECYSANALRESCHVEWGELVKRAGFTQQKTGVANGTRRQGARRFRDVEKEVDAAKEKATEIIEQQRNYQGLHCFDTPRRVWQANGRTFVAWGVR